MKVTIDFSEAEITPAIQQHIEGGISVQEYIRAGITYFNTARDIERTGKKVMGFGDKSSFSRYNTIMPTIDALEIASGEDLSEQRKREKSDNDD